MLMSSLAAATSPALNNNESPGKKKPINKPVSTKIIPAITFDSDFKIHFEEGFEEFEQML